MTDEIKLTDLHSLTDFNKAINEDKLTVVDFHAEWCGPCKQIAPVFKQLAKDHKDANFVKVDVDEAMDVAAEVGIKAMPTFMLFRNGEKITEIVGANASALKQAVTTNYAAWLAGTPVTKFVRPPPSAVEQFISSYGRFLFIAIAILIYYLKRE